MQGVGSNTAETLKTASSSSSSPQLLSSTINIPKQQGQKQKQECLLADEVRAAVEDLGWPPIVARGWATAAVAPSDGGDSDGNTVPDYAASDDVEKEDGMGTGGVTLRVLTWNVLCDGLSGSHPEKGGFLKAPEGSLDWDKRR